MYVRFCSRYSGVVIAGFFVPCPHCRSECTQCIIRHGLFSRKYFTAQRIRHRHDFAAVEITRAAFEQFIRRTLCNGLFPRYGCERWVISFLMLSNGASAMRGYSAFKAGFFLTRGALQNSQAHIPSVRRPLSPLSSGSASEQSDIAVSKRFSSRPRCAQRQFSSGSCLVFVGSQQPCAQPRVSTAVSFLMTHCACSFFVTPIESEIVTTVAKLFPEL